jgi:hypothetical protein
VKYCQRILHKEKEELVKMCYEQQINNLESGSWAKKVCEQLSKIGLGYKYACGGGGRKAQARTV